MMKPEDYKQALLTQGACNASGLIHSLAAVVTRIREESDEVKGGTDYINRHPIVVLYVTQLMHLADMGSPDMLRWAQAFRFCEKEAER